MRREVRREKLWKCGPSLLALALGLSCCVLALQSLGRVGLDTAPGGLQGHSALKLPLQAVSKSLRSPRGGVLEWIPPQRPQGALRITLHGRAVRGWKQLVANASIARQRLWPFQYLYINFPPIISLGAPGQHSSSNMADLLRILPYQRFPAIHLIVGHEESRLRLHSR